MKYLKSTLAIALLAIFAVACGSGNSNNTVETSDAEEVMTNDNATVMSVNTDNSMVTWVGYKPTGQHNGTIGITAGEIMVDGSNIVGGNFTMDINSLTALDLEAGSDNYNKLTGHLMSADFFDASNYPEAMFEVTEVKAYNASSVSADKEQFETDNTPKGLSEIMVENPTHFISGNLTMRGTTKNITFPAHVEMMNGMIKAKANFNIDRTEWGLMYGNEASIADKAKDNFIYDTVNVGFELQAGSNSMASE